jgi:hypothetical protein
VSWGEEEEEEEDGCGHKPPPQIEHGKERAENRIVSSASSRFFLCVYVSTPLFKLIFVILLLLTYRSF